MTRYAPDSLYVDGVPLPSGYWQTIDTTQFQSLNGDVGSSHTCSQPILIDGAGMWFPGGLTFSGTYPLGVIFGPTTPLVLGDSDWILTPGKTRNFLQGMATAKDCSYVAPITAATVDPQSHSVTGPTKPSLARFRFTASNGCLVNICPGGTGDTAHYPAYYTGARLQMDLRVHHKATLTNVYFFFQIGQSHANLPANQPSFRVIKIDAFGNVTPLLTNSNSGWLQMNAGSAAAYYSSGGLQQFAYACDANVVMDITQFAYFAQILDESDAVGNPSNALSGNQYVAVACAFTNIADLRPA